MATSTMATARDSAPKERGTIILNPGSFAIPDLPKKIEPLTSTSTPLKAANSALSASATTATTTSFSPSPAAPTPPDAEPLQSPYFRVLLLFHVLLLVLGVVGLVVLVLRLFNFRDVVPEAVAVLIQSIVCDFFGSRVAQRVSVIAVFFPIEAILVIVKVAGAGAAVLVDAVVPLFLSLRVDRSSSSQSPSINPSAVFVPVTGPEALAGFVNDGLYAASH